MKKRLIIIIKVCLLLVISCNTIEEKSVEEKPVEDSLLLSLVLKRSHEVGRFAVLSPQKGLDHPVIKEPKAEEGGYTVVSPQTSINHPFFDDPIFNHCPNL